LGLILNNGYGNVFKKMVDVDEQFQGWMTEYFADELSIEAGR